MRLGFTTGSCAAAAAKAACFMLLTGTEKTEITIETPKGIPFPAQIVQIRRERDKVSCGVIKDGGDDPDITTGCLILAEVSLEEQEIVEGKSKEATVSIDGGIGVGRVTKPGLDQPVGNAAINHVPREMITKEVREVCAVLDYHGTVKVVIHVPDGEEVSKKTFNPRLGIVGGISILGTSGVVEPMSSKALLDTIYVELRQKKALGFQEVAISPGNYGLDFMKNHYGYDLDKSVKCSNFIGDTLDMAVELGFQGVLLIGHIGKLIKLSGGMMNTHSKEGDCRMELLAAAGVLQGCSLEGTKKILSSVVTEEGVKILQEEGCLLPTMEYVMEKIQFFLNKRGNEKIQIETMMYANDYGLLAKSRGAEEMLKRLKEM